MRLWQHVKTLLRPLHSLSDLSRRKSLPLDFTEAPQAAGGAGEGWREANKAAPAPPRHSHPPVARPPPANQSTSKAASRGAAQLLQISTPQATLAPLQWTAAAELAAVHTSQEGWAGRATTQCRAGYAPDTLIGSRPPGYIINPHFHPVKLVGLFGSGATSNGYQPSSENESCEIRAAAALDSVRFPQQDGLEEIKIPGLSVGSQVLTGFADKQTKTSVKG